LWTAIREGRVAYIVSFSDQPPRLVCSGDEDRSTQGRRRHALSRALTASSDVTVDLSQLAWADPSLMVDLAMVARRLRRVGRGLVLHGAQPQIERLIELVGLHRQPGVRIVPALA